VSETNKVLIDGEWITYSVPIKEWSGNFSDEDIGVPDDFLNQLQDIDTMRFQCGHHQDQRIDYE